jgi:hypothetical protein
MDDYGAFLLCQGIHDALAFAGIPTIGVSLSPDNALPVIVTYAQSVTDIQLDQAEAIVANYGDVPRVKRAGYLIYGDLQALTNAQKTAVWTDLSEGSPRKYLRDAGPNAAAIAALDWSANDSGAVGASLTSARMRIAAAYVQDNPTYLVQPAFDPTINVAGDQPVT